MAINATNDSKPRELTPAGNYVARCISMIEIGTVEEEYLGKLKSLHKVRVTWEFPYELKVFDEAKGEQPVVISKEYTLSMYEKANLRKELESWRGKAFTPEEATSFDIEKLLGAPCMINVIHKPSEKDPSKVYERISAITPIAKGTVCPPQISPMFVLSYDQWDDAKFEKLPDFIKDKIKSSKEYKAMTLGESQEVNPDSDAPDDLPF